jgi:hypothetical protein
MQPNRRKTVPVGTLLYRLNHFLAHESSTPEEREVMCQFVEGVLFDTNNYLGYRYLDTNEVEGAGTRRYYYVSTHIQADYDEAALQVQKHLYGKFHRC